MEQNKENIGLDYYRIKTEWTAEKENGFLQKTKTEELVLATSYSEAESVAYSIIDTQDRRKFGSVNVEIVKTKINDVLLNEILTQESETTAGLICSYFQESEDSGVGLYAVKIMNFYVDEKSGKTKRSSETLYTPALGNADATSRIEAYFGKDMITDYVIRDVKFDKAEAIYLPKDIFQSKIKKADLNS